jgi:predicted nucleic acid-binding protein
VDTLTDLLQRENIAVHQLDKGTALIALLMCRASGRIAFGDALILAAARDSGPSVVYSFDRRFPSDEVEIREP